jgi:hypothetical protein
MSASDLWAATLSVAMFVAGVVLFVRDLRDRSRMRKEWEQRP